MASRGWLQISSRNSQQAAGRDERVRSEDDRAGGMDEKSGEEKVGRAGEGARIDGGERKPSSQRRPARETDQAPASFAHEERAGGRRPEQRGVPEIDIFTF